MNKSQKIKNESNMKFDASITAKDYLIMGILCLLFAVLVFIRIGNIKAPQSFYETSSDNKEIVLDFGEEVELGRLDIYLGNIADRKVSIYSVDPQTNEKNLVMYDVVAEKVFQWNVTDFTVEETNAEDSDASTSGLTNKAVGRKFVLICRSNEGVFNEFVFKDTKGNVLLPVNYGDYPALFDEQEMLCETKQPTHMEGTYFDEIYHGRTGYEFVNGITTYETTHPHLGKCLIALGIKMFGMTPFGMRFFSAIFGILFIPLMYIFAKRLLGSTLIATVAGFLITFDCMHYALSRIATIDIFVAFFIVASYYFMYEYVVSDTKYRRNLTKMKLFPPASVYVPLGLSGIMMGLGVATKFTGIFGGIGLAVILFAHLFKYPPKRQTLPLFFYCVLIFIVFTLSVYTLANIPTVENTDGKDMTDTSITCDEDGLHIGYGRTDLVSKTIRNTQYMVYYHTHLDSEHVYQSPFYMWPIDRVPLVAVYRKLNDEGIVSTISYVGNPAVWFMEIPCILFLLVTGIQNLIIWVKNFFSKEKKNTDVIPLFLSVAYLAQYIPWFGVSRITFIYHYFPSVIFGMLIVCYAFKRLLSDIPDAKKYVFIYLAIVVIFFAAYFPVVSGLPIPAEYWAKIANFGGWR